MSQNNQPYQGDVAPGLFTTTNSSVDLQRQIDELRRDIDDKILNHRHDGGGAARIDLDTDVFGQFEVVDTAPTGKPGDLFGQIKIYKNGSTYRLYWYDSTNDAWRYATGT